MQETDIRSNPVYAVIALPVERVSGSYNITVNAI